MLTEQFATTGVAECDTQVPPQPQHKPELLMPCKSWRLRGTEMLRQQQ
jgi:hypothetical protein